MDNIDKKIIAFLSSGMKQSEIADLFKSEGIKPNHPRSIEERIKKMKLKHGARTSLQLIHILTKQEMNNKYDLMLEDLRKDVFFIKHYLLSKGNNKFWKEEETRYLIENYENQSAREIAEHLGRNTNSVRHKANMLRLKKI